MHNKHLIIIPFYNEELYLDKCLNSIINQSLTPNKLILVDDNSTDKSSEIAKEFSTRFDWIEYHRHSSADKKEQGVKVIKAFNFGLAQSNFESFDFISKLDADLEFPQNYFELVFQGFTDSKVGVAGGRIQELNNKNWKTIPQASYHIRGALKTYRIKCFKQIEGFMPVLGWDGLDEMKAFYHGWESKIIEADVKHFRVAASDYNQTKLSFKKGKAAYMNGANFRMTILRTLNKLRSKPYIISAVSFFFGYLKLSLKREKKHVDKDLARFINKFHSKRIF